MRLILHLVFSVAFIASIFSPVSADDLRNEYKPKFMAPANITDPCTDLIKTFTELRLAIDTSSGQAAAAGTNAKGLGFFSGNKHFRSIEDNFIVINNIIGPSLDQATDIPLSVDSTPAGTTKDAALELSKAYQISLKQIKQYALAALVVERSAHGKRKSQSQAFGSGRYAEIRNAHDSEMSADEARAILDGNDADVQDANRLLKLPEFHWHKACPSSQIPHQTIKDTMTSQ